MVLFVTVIITWLAAVVFCWVIVWRRTSDLKPSVRRAALRSAVVTAALAVGPYLAGGMWVIPAPASLVILTSFFQIVFCSPATHEQRIELFMQTVFALIGVIIFWFVAFLVTLWHQGYVARSRHRSIHTVHVSRGQ